MLLCSGLCLVFYGVAVMVVHCLLCAFALFVVCCLFACYCWYSLVDSVLRCLLVGGGCLLFVVCCSFFLGCRELFVVVVVVVRCCPLLFIVG